MAPTAPQRSQRACGHRFRDVLVTSEYQEPDESKSYDNELLHTRMRLTGTGEDGTPVDVTGVVRAPLSSAACLRALVVPCLLRHRHKN